MNYKKILVFRTGHLGDTLVSLPAFWAIRKTLPDAEITLLSNINKQNPQYVLAQSVLPERGLFDHWMTYPTEISKYKTIQSFGRLFREIRRENFDVLFYLMNRNRNLSQIKRDEIFFRLAGIKKIIGLNYLKENVLNFSEYPYFKRIESEGEFFVNCLKNDNFPIQPRNKLKPEMLLTEKEINFSNRWLVKNAGEYYQEKILVGVAPGSKWESKVWKEEKFSNVVRHLIEKKNIFPVIFGGLEDKEKGDRLIINWKTGANAAGSLNIRQAAAALKKCSLYLGNDTGTMHLAACVGTRCVAVFAAIDYEGRWYPFGDQHRIFRKKVECEGCHTPDCFNDHKCLELIEETKVLKACLEILENE